MDDDESKPKGPSKPRHMDRPGWERAWSRSNMDWYWWNRETNESTWMDPIDFALAKEMPPTAAGKKGGGVSNGCGGGGRYE